VETLDKKRIENLKKVCPGVAPAHSVFLAVDQDNSLSAEAQLRQVDKKEIRWMV